MTMTVEPRGVSSDRVDQDPRRWPVALATLVVGVIVGALIGLIYAAAASTTHTATTALSVLPDPTIDITSANGSESNVPTQDATSFIQSQLVVINGQQLADRVRSRAGLTSAPQVTATQVGQTYVVQISATAASSTQATEVARLTGTLYAQTRTRQLQSEISGLVTSTDQQLKAVRSSLGNANSSSSNPLTPSQTALQTEYERLLSVRSSLAATRSQAAQIVTTVSPAHATSAGLSSKARDALAGAILGAIVALLALVVFRRAISRIRSVGDLSALDVPVLLPVQPRRSVRRSRLPAFVPSSEARLLAARLHAGMVDNVRPLVVIGTDTGVGASEVATSIAGALAGRAPVLLVRQSAPGASDAVSPPADGSATATLEPGEPGPGQLEPAAVHQTAPHDFRHAISDIRDALNLAKPFAAGGGAASSITHPADDVVAPPWLADVQVRASTIAGVWLLDAAAMPSGDTAATLRDVVDVARQAGWLVVVDADPVSRSDAGLDCARDGAVLALVVGRGRSAPASVLAAVELFEADRVALLGAVLNDVPGPLGRLARRRLITPVKPARGGLAGAVNSLPRTPERRSAAGSNSSGPNGQRPSQDQGRDARQPTYSPR